jgi:hypothetical protein
MVGHTRPGFVQGRHAKFPTPLNFLVKPLPAAKSAQPDESKQKKLLPNVAYLGQANWYSEIKELERSFLGRRGTSDLA